MTTNINFYGKPFGAPLLPNKMTSDGWSIADARHIGGHRIVDVIDDLYELYDWQLINPSALLGNDTDSAIGQKWYVKNDGTYMLKSYANRKSRSGWVKVEDANGNAWTDTDNSTVLSIINSKLGKDDANKANGAIVLDGNGNIPSSVTAFKKINGKSILKTSSDTSDITIDLSLFVIPTNNTLPTSGINANKIYLIKNADAPDGSSNVYIEYMYINNAWEKLGEYKSDVDLSGYLTLTSAELTYVKKATNSPATYVLYSANTLPSSTSNMNTYAASVNLLYYVNANLENSISSKAASNHTHVITINNKDFTLDLNKVNIGNYVESSEFGNELGKLTYTKEEIDIKIKDVTAESLNISTLTDSEIDTMFTQIFG